MDVIQLERDLTAWIAAILEKEVDAGVFRGGIPASMPTGVGVMLKSEIKGIVIDQQAYNVQILGKFNDRDEAMQMLDKINRAIPCYGKTAGSFTLTAVIPRGDSEPYTYQESGVVKTYASRNLIISVLTK